MSGLAGVPDVAFSGLVGRASRPSPNSASAPQGSPCEFALCCYFYFQGTRVFKQCSSHRRGSGESSRSGAIRWVGFGQGAAMRGRVDESGARAWCRYARNARALVSARACLPCAMTRPSRRAGFFATSPLEKEKKAKSENRNARGSHALRERARARAREGSGARTIARSARKRARARASARAMLRCVE